MSNLTANIPMIGNSCGCEFKVYGNFSHVRSKMGHPCTCSVVTLAAATHQPRGTERTARALGFSPLPNASKETNEQKVLAAEMHYNYHTSTLIHIPILFVTRLPIQDCKRLIPAATWSKVGNQLRPVSFTMPTAADRLAQLLTRRH